jgi:hypothetical protein
MISCSSVLFLLIRSWICFISIVCSVFANAHIISSCVLFKTSSLDDFKFLTSAMFFVVLMQPCEVRFSRRSRIIPFSHATVVHDWKKTFSRYSMAICVISMMGWWVSLDLLPRVVVCTKYTINLLNPPSSSGLTSGLSFFHHYPEDFLLYHIVNMESLRVYYVG